MTRWEKFKARYEALIAEYGKIAILTYFTIFFGTWGTLIALIRAGFDFESAAGTTGVVVAAYAVTKVTQPIRIGATLVLTPVVARLIAVTGDPTSG